MVYDHAPQNQETNPGRGRALLKTNANIIINIKLNNYIISLNLKGFINSDNVNANFNKFVCISRVHLDVYHWKASILFVGSQITQTLMLVLKRRHLSIFP